VNEAEVPTAAFILDPDAKFPTTAMKAKIRDEAGDDGCHFIDATSIATALLGDSIASNLFLLGFAWQRGLVPVSAAALEEAIELNGVAIDFNKQAFLWGRRYADQPQRVLALLQKDVSDPAPLNLDQLIDDRAQRLTQYQNGAYAQRYRDRVAKVRKADPQAEIKDSITFAVAQNLYKLMAYKDEYEVARLYSDGKFQRQLREQFEGDFQLRFNLAPPLFSKRDPNTGHLMKQEFGPWMLQAFGLLAKFKFLRGTALDIFGHSAERRQERADIEEYRQLLEEILPDLGNDNYAAALQLAELPGKLRGFGHVKDRNRERLASRRNELMAEFRGDQLATELRVIAAA
jgi:indolepyruvate ferredoxin oxidoreductase